MNTKIFFVRHGEVDNPNKIWYGRLPGFGLSSNGKKQIYKTAQFLSRKNIDVVYASPLLRTKQTANIISKILNLPINYSRDILEVKSLFQGKTTEYILSQTTKFNIFTQETIEDVSKRMQKFIDKIIKKYKGKNIAVVSHGDPIMIAKAQNEKLLIEINSIRPVRGYIQFGEIFPLYFSS